MKILPYFVLAVLFCLPVDAEEQPAYFAIQVLEESTGRGVPLVELETLNQLRFVTDSHGRAAIAEPDLTGQTVYFTVRSHGYEFPADGFGYRGKAFLVQPGKTEVLKLKRLNLAERLYRVTGSGIYRDSVLLKEPVPLQKPLLNAEVFGCDSVMTAFYQGKIHWFWGDTNRPQYPLGGNFHISGATSLLPDAGGLPPETGVDLTYFTGQTGAVRPLAQMPGEGPTWLGALAVLPDETGRERMYAGYVKIRNHLEAYLWGFVCWNDETGQFEEVSSFAHKPALFPESQTHTFLKQEGATRYVYLTSPLPLTRVKAESAAFLDPARYEGYTCLLAGTLPADQQLDRDSHGRLRYSWKIGTPPLSPKDEEQLVKAGVMQPEERLHVLREAETGRHVQIHNGSVYWNEYRHRWILITTELHGSTSLLGEIWFAEADQPTGPWTYTRKIVTHNNYTFYNPKHHPLFDQQQGQIIYFEGTYTTLFSGNPQATPRYDYNQVMYRLDLSQAGLHLPVAFYQSPDSGDSSPFAVRQSDTAPAFYALEQASEQTVPITWNGTALRAGTPADTSAPLFHALPADFDGLPQTTTALYEYCSTATKPRIYSTRPDWSKPGYQRTPTPVCHVWKTQKTTAVDSH